MVTFTDFTVDREGMGRYLAESTELAAACLAHAEVGVRFAQGIAPVGPADDPHRGEFRDSIRAELHPSTDRVGARIVAAPIWVEFGRKRRHPYAGAHVLHRTGQFLNAPKRSG